MSVATKYRTSREQTMEALEVANRIRQGRAQIKRDIRDGRQNLLPLILDPPDAIRAARVTEILCALPRFGAVRTDKVMRKATVGAGRRMGELTERERKALILRLRSYGVR